MKRRILAGFIALGLVAAVLVLPWGVPFDLWTSKRVAARIGNRSVTLVRNPGNGMAGVSSLGSLDGMLFELTAPATPGTGGWQMAGVSMPLDIAFFAPSGELVGTTTMDICRAEPCPVYDAASPYIDVVETPAGSLPFTAGDHLTFE